MNGSKERNIYNFRPSKEFLELLSKPYVLPGNHEEDVYIMGISGGVDSCALAILMTMKYPSVKFNYFFTDTEADHSETYKTLEAFESFMDRKIEFISPAHGLYDLIDKYNGFLPSANKRYCTKELKIAPLKKKMAEITPFMSLAKVHSFVGLRADEPARVGFSAENDQHQIHFPYREMGVVKKDVFLVMNETIGIPRFYLTKTRSGCSSCFFQRKGELSMQIQWFPKDHYKAKSVEKLHESDASRFQAKPVAPTETFKVARNWLQYPLPQTWEVAADHINQPISAKVTEGMSDLFVAVEFELGTPLFGEPFVGFAQIVATSTSAVGLKKQVDGRWAHMLDSLWMKYSSEEELRRDCRYVIYHVKADDSLLDTSRQYHKSSYTLHKSWSLEQAEHWIGWADSILLHASKGLAHETSASLESLVIYVPKDPVINDFEDSREEEIAEEGEEEGSRAICWACSI